MWHISKLPLVESILFYLCFHTTKFEFLVVLINIIYFSNTPSNDKYTKRMYFH